MRYPNAPGKHRGDAVITPRASREHFGREYDLPERVVLCFHDDVVEHAREHHGATRRDAPWGAVHVVDDIGVGVTRVPGVGAPITVLVMEEYAELGTREFVLVGHVGSLQPDLDLGDVVLVERALRDEGTSHHYIEPAPYVASSSGTRERLTDALRWLDQSFTGGGTWTTDAPYRETNEEVARYREEGLLTVDMEAAAAFAVAQHRNVEAGALFTISDRLTPEGWEPFFGETTPHLGTLCDAAIEALAP